MYLIVRCDQLNDQYECDADRSPITLTEDWKKWFDDNHPQYLFEVYEFRVSGFEQVKSYETPMERGMALYYWDKDHQSDEDYTYPTAVIQKWPNATRDDDIPDNVLAFAREYYDGDAKDMKMDLYCGGSFGWEDDQQNWWVYGTYHDSFYDLGY